VVYLLVLTQLNDVSQYVLGKCIGNKKVAPEISPNKTRAGLFGGILITVLLSLLMAPVLTPFSHLMALIVGMLIAITGFFGDLSMSAIKRDLGIKNTGNLLPGHGGILDRVDSLTFTAPVFFYVLYYYSVNSGYIT
jgi:phosphatidate cytidylyltransferase